MRKLIALVLSVGFLLLVVGVWNHQVHHHSSPARPAASASPDSVGTVAVAPRVVLPSAAALPPAPKLTHTQIQRVSEAAQLLADFPGKRSRQNTIAALEKLLSGAALNTAISWLDPTPDPTYQKAGVMIMSPQLAGQRQGITYLELAMRETQTAAGSSFTMVVGYRFGLKGSGEDPTIITLQHASRDRE